MAADKVPVTAGVGTNLQTWKNTIGPDDVHAEAVVLVDSTGTEKAVATEPTLVDVHGHADAIQTDLALVHAHIGQIDATLTAEEVHVGSIDGKITACNTGAVVVSSGTITTITNVVHVDDNASTLSVDGTLTQSTKHDSKIYAPAIFDAAASGNLVAAVPNKVTKLHAMTIQAQGTVIVNLKNGAAGASLMEWSFQAREGAVLPLASAPAYWAVTSQNTILYVTLSGAVQVTITAIVSSDDAA